MNPSGISKRGVVNTIIMVAGLVLAVYVIASYAARVAPSPKSESPTANGRPDYAGKKPAGVVTLSASELKKILDAKTERVVLVDLRERDQFRDGHIQSALNIPFDELEVRAEDELSKSDRIVLIYFECGSENTVSAINSASLHALGFRNVSILDAGIDSWKRSSYAVLKGSN